MELVLEWASGPGSFATDQGHQLDLHQATVALAMVQLVPCEVGHAKNDVYWEDVTRIEPLAVEEVGGGDLVLGPVFPGGEDYCWAELRMAGLDALDGDSIRLDVTVDGQHRPVEHAVDVSLLVELQGSPSDRLLLTRYPQLALDGRELSGVSDITLAWLFQAGLGWTATARWE